MSGCCNSMMLEPDSTLGPVTDGFVPVAAAAESGFVSRCGNFHFNAERSVLATRIASHHLNSARIAHGGMLATLADSAFGVVIRHKLALRRLPFTIGLAIDYLSPARVGDWVEANVEIYKIGRRIGNANCLLKVDERLVLRASGSFIMEEEQVAGQR